MAKSTNVNSKQSKPLGVFTSDWHLKPYTWGARPEIKGDSYRSAMFIKNWCIENHLPLHVLGDITDVRNPDPGTVGWLMDIINDCEKAGVPFRFLQGQHELHRKRPWASLHKWSTWLHRTTYALGNSVLLYGLDFQPMGELQDDLTKIPSDIDVLLAHQVWKERMGNLRNDESRPAEGAFADIPTVKMVISGDFHAHKVTKYKGKDGQDLVAVSPGSTYLKTLDEDPDKYFYVLHEDLLLKSIKIPTRPMWRNRVGTTEALDKYIESFVSTNPEINENDPNKPLWYVEFRPSVNDAVGRLERAAKNRAHLFTRPLLKRERHDLIDTEEVHVEQENTDRPPTALEDFLPRCCKPDSQVFNTAVRLNRSQNVKEEVQQIVQEVVTEADKESEGWSDV